MKQLCVLFSASSPLTSAFTCFFTSEVHSDHARNTGSPHCGFMFSNGYGFSGLLEKYCEVGKCLVCMFLIYVELGHLVLLITFFNCFWIRFLSPLSVVPCVTFTGLGLYHLGFPMVM